MKNPDTVRGVGVDKHCHLCSICKRYPQRAVDSDLRQTFDPVPGFYDTILYPGNMDKPDRFKVKYGGYGVFFGGFADTKREFCRSVPQLYRDIYSRAAKVF